MEGQRLSHYEIGERLGGGGMGVVYKALDTKLNRHVALKFLPPELTRDDDARQRFMQEAQAASALDHPNICTIHEIDAAPDGQLFIAMAFYDGETLKARIARGPLPVKEALDLAIQIGQGLAKAHANGIVHRDVKPANLMVTGDGFLKIVDFGIAKLMDVTGPTQTGTTLGTVSYMSPEQVEGEPADQRSDVWALGAVLYEMLTGARPFQGESHWVIMAAISNADPEAPRSLRAEIPEDVEGAIMGALTKDKAKRAGSAEELVEQLEACRLAMTGPTPSMAMAASPWAALRRPAVAVPLVTGVVAIGALAVIGINRGAVTRQAREEGLPQMLAMLDQDDYAAAFAIGREIERHIPDDPILAQGMERAAVTGAIITEPPGASVYVRPYSDPNAEWRLLGQSPLDAVRLPRESAIQLRVEAEGYEPRLLASAVPGLYFGRASSPVITLSEAGSIPADMVWVPGGSYGIRITGFNSAAQIELAPYLIDRHEVTNEQYKEFVDAGGYETPEYWEGLDYIRDDEVLTWDQAVAGFVDTSGRPGPAGWELGDYPEGQGDHPARGVSWYEAVAYLRFRDKSLPTIYHWARAAQESHNIRGSLTSEMLPLANFGGEGPMAVGASGAMGPHGTLDTAGNVKEWCWNASGAHRWLMGGAWDDEARMHSVRFTSPPFDRSHRNGFRGVRYLEGQPRDSVMAPVELQPRDHRGAVAVSDEVFEIYRSQMRYVPGELDAHVEGVIDSSEDWTLEHVTLDAGADGERFSIYLYLPQSAPAPYQPLVYFPGLGPFQTQRSRPTPELMPRPGDPITSLVRSGRAVVVPIWKGSFDRWDGFLSLSGEEYVRTFRARMADWASDLGRTIDYLETRDDVQGDRVGYVGTSFGSSTALALLSLEDRLSAALLYLPGYTYRELPPEADAVNYVPRVTIPVLMIGGRYDYVFPVETSAQPLFDQLGTPAEHKRFILYDMGHGPLPRGQFLRDVLPWLDEYLGPAG
jgi:formylglycine-generating enzyme required for sulfatase activity/dienelactone hydrolase